MFLSKLEKYLEKWDNGSFNVYEDIKKAAKKIWLTPRLAWFTDHGIKHSERVISLLDQICDALLQNPKDGLPTYGLVPTEVFLLLSSAWLHDIGMQDLSDLNARSVDALREEDWDAVRKRHPQQSYDIIMDSAAGATEDNAFGT